jgi:GNAT superfamily N-acetyltransferase
MDHCPIECEITEAALADYPVLCELFDEGDALHREYLPHIFRRPDGPARDPAYVAALIEDPTVGLFVARAQGQAIGLIVVLVRESPDIPILVPRCYATIDHVVVRASYRRTGVGRALMERAQVWALAQGVETVELHVWEFNQDAIPFYEQLGYETVSRKMSKRLR